MTGQKVSYEAGSIEAGLANGARLLDLNPAAAGLQARTLIEAAPRDPAPHRLLAMAMARLGYPDRARDARANAVRLSRSLPTIKKARAALDRGRAGEARTLLAAHLSAYPDDPVALLIDGEALAQMGRMAEAAKQFDAALAFMPEYREAGVALVRVHFHRFDPRSALDALEPLLQEKPDDIPLLRWKVAMLAELDGHEKAEAISRALVRMAPGDPALRLGHGDILRMMGRTADAEAEYRKAIFAAPERGAPWWSLASLGGDPITANDRTALQRALATVKKRDERTYLLFAEGTAADRAGEHERAFELFGEGNRLRRATLKYDGAAFAQRMDGLEAALDDAFFDARSAWGAQASDPIFIVGMARSGTTLVEQLLARHSAVAAAGEMPVVTSLLRETAARMGLDPEPQIVQLLRQLTAADCAALGAEYLRRARDRIGTAAARFTDKLPHNWAELAFIRLILPHAQVIDVRRGALDCIVSNFALLFQPGHPASYDLDEMADYFATYVKAMDWIDRAMPGAVFRLRYEKLVDDPEAEMRAALAFLGLDFEPACLEPGGSGAIATASAEQARRPINREGIGRWKRFEPWLGALRDKLGPLAAA